MTSAKLLDKLAKIKAHEESARAIGSEAEAQAFADKLQSMLLEHKLSMSDVEAVKLNAEEPVVDRMIDYDGLGVDRSELKRSFIEWQGRLAKIIAEANFCKIIVVSGTNMFTLVGRESDIKVAEYLIVTMIRAADRISKKEYERFFYECRDRGRVEEARGFRASFLRSFIFRLFERFNERMTNQNPHALVRINSEKKAVEDHMSKIPGLGRQLIKGSSGKDNVAGLVRGREAADELKLDSNAIEGRTAERGQLR
jgi:hypothetical protein